MTLQDYTVLPEYSESNATLSYMLKRLDLEIVSDFVVLIFQVRKLEFVLAEAIHSKCDTVLTCGGIPSNHCRTTAVAARQLGLNCYLFLRSSEQASELEYC